MKLILIVAFSVFLWLPCVVQAQKAYTTQEVDAFPFFSTIDCSEKGTEACFENQLKHHITEVFRYPLEALEKNIQGKVYVQFIIDSTGVIGNIKTRSVHDILEKEGTWIVKKIPQLNPAKLNGKSVAMVYNLPISFNRVMVDATQDYSAAFPKIIEIDAHSKDTTNLVSYEKTHTPPILTACQNTDYKVDCFKDAFKYKLTTYAQEHGYYSKTVVPAKVYFEISKTGSISEINIVTPDEKFKKQIESYIKTQIKILKPAMNASNLPVSCFFATEVYFSQKT